VPCRTAARPFAAQATGDTGKGCKARIAAAGLKDWRFDFALPDYLIAVEIEGGAWTNGRHTRGKGFSEDLRKYGAAQCLGWTVYRCDARMVQAGIALQSILTPRRIRPQRSIAYSIAE